MEPQGAKCQAEPISHLAELQLSIPNVRWINIYREMISLILILPQSSYLKRLSVECIEQPHDAPVGSEEDVLPVRALC